MAEPMKKRRQMTVAHVDGFAVMKDGNVIMKTRNPADQPRSGRSGFDLNLRRRLSVEGLITDRHGFICNDRERAFGYLTVAANAIIMARVLRGWRMDVGPIIEWAKHWVPCLTEKEIRGIVSKISRRPRGLTAQRAGKLLDVTKVEIDRLKLQTLQPVDVSRKAYTKERDEKKREADRKRITAIRRAQGVRPVSEISQGSVAAFCREHGLNRSSYRKAAAKGPEALTAFLLKKGIFLENEKWPDVSVSKHGTPYRNSATPLATFPKSSTSTRCARGPAEAIAAEGENMLYPMKAARAAAPLGLSALRNLPADTVEKLDQSASLDDRLKTIAANFDKQIGATDGDRK